MQMTFKFGLGDKVKVDNGTMSNSVKNKTWEVNSIRITTDGVLYELIHGNGYIIVYEDALVGV